MIKGITVTLFERTQTGIDELGVPVYSETAVEVPGVLVSPSAMEDIVSLTQLYGKRAVYELCIPKKDTHTWEDCRIDFFGQSFRAFGPVKEYIEQNVPLKWNKKVQVERYA